MSDFLKGFSYSLSGFRLITRPGIRLYILIPILVNAFLFSIIMLLGIIEFSALVDWVEQQSQWLSWIGWLLWPLFILIVFTVSFFCFAVFGNFIASPFNGMLAEAVELHITRASVAAGSSTSVTLLSIGMILNSISSEIRKLLYILLRTIPLLLLFLVPGIQILAPPIWIIFAAWIMALEYLEYPLGNHGKEFIEVRKIVAAHKSLSLGFGLGVTLLTAIPLINFIAMPVAVAGATRLYRDRFKAAAPATTD